MLILCKHCSIYLEIIRQISINLCLILSTDGSLGQIINEQDNFQIFFIHIKTPMPFIKSEKHPCEISGQLATRLDVLQVHSRLH